MRLLGQILGDTVREHEGDDAFEIVEAMRRLSVAFQREADEGAGRNLDSLSKRLSPREMLTVTAPSLRSRECSQKSRA